MSDEKKIVNPEDERQESVRKAENEAQEIANIPEAKDHGVSGQVPEGMSFASNNMADDVQRVSEAQPFFAGDVSQPDINTGGVPTDNLSAPSFVPASHKRAEKRQKKMNKRQMTDGQPMAPPSAPQAVQNPAPQAEYPSPYAQGAQWQAPQAPVQQPPVYGQTPYTAPTQQPVYGQPSHHAQPQAPPQAPYPPQGGRQSAQYYQQPQQVHPTAPPTYNPYGYYPPQQKNTGLKVFLWVLSILVVGTLVGFVIFSINVVNNGYDTQSSFEEIYPDFVLPPEAGEGEPDTDEPNMNDPDESELPDIQLDPNPAGIAISAKPVGEQLTPEAIYDKVSKSTVGIDSTYTERTTGNEYQGSGTGIIATKSGYVITNSHVVMNSKSTRVVVTTYDGEEHDAIVVGVDRTTDLAVLKMNGTSFDAAEFGNIEEHAIGEAVLAIGNPGGRRFSGSLTGGFISGLDREVGEYSENGMTYIQTDAAINPGNSGGPLVNMYGQVIGINSSKIVTAGYEGMGFAIPVSKAENIINELMGDGYVKGRTRLGITGTDISEFEAVYSSIPQGFKIVTIADDSVFSGTKAKIDDIIIAVDGEEVKGLADLSNILLLHSPGDEVTVTLYRESDTPVGKSSEFDVKITLIEDKGETQG